jgi:hypothetical protein
MLFTFAIYDNFVRRRNEKILFEVVRSQAIVSTLFPATVRDRLFPVSGMKRREKGHSRPMKHLLEDSDDNDFLKSKPIADLFPETTILFADVAGFTAWSSTRDPCQVSPTFETKWFRRRHG